MSIPTVKQLLVALASPVSRAESARQLAAHLGVEELVLLVKDAALHTLLPAPAMAQTLRGGPAWYAFVKQSETPGHHFGEVDLLPGALRQAIACSTDQGTLILVGGQSRNASLEDIDPILPLVIAMLSAEHRLVLAAEEVRDARDSEHRTRALAGALEQARAEASRLNAELSAEDRHKNEFLVMLAHELRNPLAPLVNAIAVLRKQYPDSSVQRTLDLMSRQVGHLSRLVEDLMDTSRVSQGKIDLRVELMDLRVIVAAAIEDNHAQFAAKNHRVSATDTGEALMVLGDPARLKQIFGNLLINAAKYTDPGGDITVTMNSQAGQAVVEVADNGIGIDATMLPRVFALFAQARGTLERAQGGLGIGLNLVKQLAELHEGTIDARSAGLGQGSVFTVRIPLARQAEGRYLTPKHFH